MKKYSELRKACIDRNMTAGDLASQIGITESVMSNILNGKRDFKLSEIRSIVNVLDLDATKIPLYFFT